MTLFLCKMDPTAKDKNGDPKFVAVVGRVVNDANGYRFLPNVSSHKASRKFHKSANACIPKWTEQLGFLRLLDQAEMLDLTGCLRI